MSALTHACVSGFFWKPWTCFGTRTASSAAAATAGSARSAPLSTPKETSFFAKEIISGETTGKRLWWSCYSTEVAGYNPSWHLGKICFCGKNWLNVWTRIRLNVWSSDKSDDFNSFLMHLFFWRSSNFEWIFVRCGLYSKEVGTVACSFCGQALTIKVLPTVLSWSVGYCN